jgi:hypothetical protein
MAIFPTHELVLVPANLFTIHVFLNREPFEPVAFFKPVNLFRTVNHVFVPVFSIREQLLNQ